MTDNPWPAIVASNPMLRKQVQDLVRETGIRDVDADTLTLVPLPRSCESTRYGRYRECNGRPEFDVVYSTGTPPTEHDRHPACFRHALAEVDRHYASAGMAQCEMQGPVR